MPNSMQCTLILSVFVLVFFGSPFCGAPRAIAADELSANVEAIFVKHCFDCHSGQSPESSFALDALSDEMFAGGDSGDMAIVPGKPLESSIVAWISSEDDATRMPPEGKSLSPAEIETVKKWIQRGAEYDAPFRNQNSELWSFKPIQRELAINPQDLSTIHQRSVVNPVDMLVAEKLQDNELTFSRPANKRDLIRRLYLVMLGLPPRPSDVEEFVNDTRDDSYSRLVDRVLLSPAYGERWAQHWLDIVRFGETHGFETNRERPNAWPYRDYVIDALNLDKPYDQFVKEQIAGDQMGVDVATGFIVAGPHDIVKSPDINLTLMQRQDELADIVNATGTTFLGLTLGCARCHNHKFDPILQKDFYSMQAVFAGVNHADRRLVDETGKQQIAKLQREIAEAKSQLAAIFKDVAPKQLLPPVNFQKNVEAFPSTEARIVRFTVSKTSGAEPCIDEIEVFSGSENVALNSKGAIVRASSNLPGYEIHQIKHVNDGKFGNENSWISNEPNSGWIEIEFAKVHEINRIVWGRDRSGKIRDRLPISYKIEIKKDGQDDVWTTVANSKKRNPFGNGNDLEPDFELLSKANRSVAKAVHEGILSDQAQLKEIQSSRLVYAGTFSPPAATHRLYRGDPLQKREEVEPNTVVALGSLKLEKNAPEASRRVALANWLTQKNNPLLARVIVNRIWQHTFGRGIVATPNDFGNSGRKPTHPRMLDYLATELIESGWSMKHVHRILLTSNTFRQSSEPNKIGLAKDSGGELLWRFTPRRMAAEVMRDSMIAASGVLDNRMEGKGFDGFEVEMENVRHFFPKKSYGPVDWRRMVYMTKVRQEKDSVFGVFDCPDGSQIISRRSRSTTPLQSLNLLNSTFALQQAELFAQRLERWADEPSEQIATAYQFVFSRRPTLDELKDSTDFIAEFGLPAFCRAIFNSNEFLFIQ